MIIELARKGRIKYYESICTDTTSFKIIKQSTKISSYDADANRLMRQLDWKDLSTQFKYRKL